MSETVFTFDPGQHCAGSPLLPDVTSSFAVHAKRLGVDSTRRHWRVLCTVNSLLAVGKSLRTGRKTGKKVFEGLSKNGDVSAYGVDERFCVTGTENKYCPIFEPSLSEAYTFQCVQRASQITARPLVMDAKPLAVNVRLFDGDVAVAAWVSAVLEAF